MRKTKRETFRECAERKLRENRDMARLVAWRLEARRRRESAG